MRWMVQVVKPMRLYIWQGDGVLEAYGTGIIVVLAHDDAEAQRLVDKQWNFDYPSYLVAKAEVIDLTIDQPAKIWSLYGSA